MHWIIESINAASTLYAADCLLLPSTIDLTSILKPDLLWDG